MFINKSGFDNINSIQKFTTEKIAIEEKLELIKISEETECELLAKFVDNNLLGTLRIK